MKKSSTSQKTESFVKQKQQSPQSVKHPARNSNDYYLYRSLRLLGVTDAQFLKQTKVPLQCQYFFPKNISTPSNSKSFFYIVLKSMKELASEEDFKLLQMWYMPKTINQMLQFKKTLHKIIIKLEASGVLPNNVLISKAVIMGDSQPSTVTEFLRILAQFAVRQLYIAQYSKEFPLIQLQLTSSSVSETDINKFYVYPFIGSQSHLQQLPLSTQKIDQMKQLFKVYIDRMRKKILGLKGKESQSTIEVGDVMAKILQQKQLAQTLQSRLPKAIFSQNRAFDRRILIDKTKQIWKGLFQLDCPSIEPQLQSTGSVLRLQGQVDKLIAQWQPSAGISKVRDATAMFDKMGQLKKKCESRLKQFRDLNKSILEAMEAI